MLYPLQMFCCGCSIGTGSYFVLYSHLLFCVGLLSLISADLIFRSKNTLISGTSEDEMLWHAGWCMIGIPIIVSGIWGIAGKSEQNIRLYLYYLLACFVVNFVILSRTFLLEDFCNNGKATTMTAMQANFGEAFMCGVFLIFSYFFVAASLLVQAYCLWLIWSLAEDIKHGSLGPELHELLPSRDGFVKRTKRDYAETGDIVGLAHAKLPGPYPPTNTGYDSINSVGMPGQAKIFGGNNHEVNYPPPLQNGVF